MEAEPSGKCREAGGKTLEGQFKEELGSYRESHELQSDEDYSCYEDIKSKLAAARESISAEAIYAEVWGELSPEVQNVLDNKKREDCAKCLKVAIDSMEKALAWDPDYLERKTTSAVQTLNAVVISPEAQEALRELYDSNLESVARDAAESLVHIGPISELENLKDRLEQKVEVFAHAPRTILEICAPTDIAQHTIFVVLVLRTEGKYQHFGYFVFRSQKQ